MGGEEWDGMGRGDKKRKRDTNKMSKQKTKKPDFLMEACGQYLAEWDSKTYKKGEQITKAMFDSAGDMPEGLEPWQPFETYPPDEIADLCIMLGDQFEKMFNAGAKYASKGGK